MSSKCKVLVIDPRTMFIEKLKQQLPLNWSLVIPSSFTEDEALKLVSDVDVIVSLTVSRRLIEDAKKLKMIQSIGSGVDRINIDAANDRGVVVCSTTGLNAIPAAEHVLALMLALAKHIKTYDRMFRSGGWMRIPSTLLKGKTLGIVGLGSIGVEVAKRAKAFGMRIIAIKRHPSEELQAKLGLKFLGGKNDLPHIMKESDFLVLSVPLTPETKKMIGEIELRMMKKTTYLVNISRGAVIDEEALIRFLKEGTIAGAGLDIFEAEPINADNPLLKLENVVLTPHVAGGAVNEEVTNKRAKFIIRNIERITKGQKPKKIVDPILKYVVEKR